MLGGIISMWSVKPLESVTVIKSYTNKMDLPALRLRPPPTSHFKAILGTLLLLVDIVCHCMTPKGLKTG